LSVFSNQDMTDDIGYLVLLASAAVPAFFPPHLIRGVPHVDGGLVMDTPLMPAIEAGADTLHVIYFDPDVKNIPLQKLQNTLDTLDRVRIISWATKMNEDIDSARWINQGLEMLERADGGGDISDEDFRLFVRVASKLRERMQEGMPYKKLTIHRYRPRTDIGGSLALLNFNRDQIVALIDSGFHDAAEHDCRANGCLLVPGKDSSLPLP
jgi:predicted acylesterase/phospholipase RssA